MKEGWGHGAETRGQVQLRTVKAEGPTKLRTAGLGWPGEPPGPPEGTCVRARGEPGGSSPWGGFRGAKGGGDVRSGEGARHHLPFMCSQRARPAPRSEVQIMG